MSSSDWGVFALDVVIQIAVSPGEVPLQDRYALLDDSSPQWSRPLFRSD